MQEIVSVGGLDVTQQVLERLFSACRAHHMLGVPSGYQPSLGLFGPIEGATATFEQVLYTYVECGSMPDWFTDEFLSTSSILISIDPTELLVEAGFPRSVWAIQRPQDFPTAPKIASWAGELGTDWGPWLWVAGPERESRLFTIGQVAIVASPLIAGQVVYKDVCDLCNEVNACSNYDKDSKYNTVRPYRDTTLLLLEGLGMERKEAPNLRTLEDLLRHRQERNLPTVLGSQGAVSDWLESWGRFDQDLVVSLRRSLGLGLCDHHRLDKDKRRAAIRSHTLVAGAA